MPIFGQAMSRVNNFSIRIKIIAIVAGILFMAILTATYIMRVLVYRNIMNQKVITSKILVASLEHDIKHHLVPQKNDFLVRDCGYIKKLINQYMVSYHIINSMSFYDIYYINVADSDPNNIGMAAQDKDIVKAIDLAQPSLSITQSDSFDLGMKSVSPIFLGSRIIGVIVLNISTKDIKSTISSINRQIFIIVIGTVLVSCIFLYFLLHSMLLKRLNRLIGITRQIAGGDYDIKMIDDQEDELGQLAQTFYFTTFEFLKSKHEIEDYNRHLEDQTEQLNKAYQELKETQSQLVLNEKMASLGLLIAGIAHEINTPVGAIYNIARNLEQRFFSFPWSDVLESLTKDTNLPRDSLVECLHEVIHTSLGNQHLTSFKEIRAVEVLLREQGIDNSSKVASVLAQLNFIDRDTIIRFVDLFRNQSIFSLIESVGSIAQAIKIAQTCSQKIEEIIRALKYYAYTDKAKMEMIQLNESINIALILLTNKLKYRAKLITKLNPDLPKLFCTSEVHQVWTNLLGNACDAIEEMGEEYGGEISICSQTINDQIAVTITDNGIGIPEDMIDKIFDPFFTTKGVGKGTGLGLSIVSGIIKKHKGTIHVKSERGHTVFEVKFPVTQESYQKSENLLNGTLIAAGPPIA